MSSPIILVPGFWLGAWAWDEVVAALRADGHEATPITLPGLESHDTDRSRVTFDDHVTAIAEAVRAADAPAVLAVHSGAGAPGYAASDRISQQIAAMVYVDSGPATAPLDPGFEGTEYPLPSWEDLGENLDGISQQQLETFRARAVPEPAGAMREGASLRDAARLDIPTTAICTAFTSDQYKEAVAEGQTWLGGFGELRNLDWVDLPTSHWPMWSRPQELATIIGDVARTAAP
jgi:pimeloyl-ACP methyl ester carboxylesterase